MTIWDEIKYKTFIIATFKRFSKRKKSDFMKKIREITFFSLENTTVNFKWEAPRSDEISNKQCGKTRKLLS